MIAEPAAQGECDEAPTFSAQEEPGDHRPGTADVGCLTELEYADDLSVKKIGDIKTNSLFLSR